MARRTEMVMQAFGILAKRIWHEGRAQAIYEASDTITVAYDPDGGEGIGCYAIAPVADDDLPGVLTYRYKDTQPAEEQGDFQLLWVLWEYDGVYEVLLNRGAKVPPTRPEVIAIRDAMRALDADTPAGIDALATQVEDRWPVFDGPPVDEEWDFRPTPLQKALGQLLGEEIRRRVEDHDHVSCFRMLVDDVKRAL